MILSGLKSRSIAENSNLSFDLNMSLNKINGSGEFGFSGENKTLSFKFISGRVNDFNNNYVYSYSANENINISGDIETGSYIYYINSEPVAIDNKTNFKINKFYTNSKDCNLNLDLNIKSFNQDYSLNINNYYYQNNYLSGNFINKMDSDVRIFSGEITQNPGFKLISVPSLIDKTGNILISTNPISATYNLKIYLYTDFGVVSKDFIVSGLTGIT